MGGVNIRESLYTFPFLTVLKKMWAYFLWISLIADCDAMAPGCKCALITCHWVLRLLPFKVNTRRKLSPRAHKCHNIWKRNLTTFTSFRPPEGIIVDTCVPRESNLVYAISTFISSYRSFHPSIFLLVQTPAESGQKSAIIRGWMLVRTIAPNMNISSRGVATSCWADKLEALCFLALFEIRDDFPYIVFRITLIETNLNDGL
jgi:hypothetical protein